MSSPNTSTVVEEVKYTSAVDGVEFKTFILKLNGVTIELSSYGACIAKFLVPSRHGGGHDDIVLGYNTSDEFRTTKNPSYFGCVVGRVANRIALGRLQIEQGDPRTILIPTLVRIIYMGAVEVFRNGYGRQKPSPTVFASRLNRLTAIKGIQDH